MTKRRGYEALITKVLNLKKYKNMSMPAKILGLSERNLYHKMRRHGITERDDIYL